jgi:hypothetical protein
MARHGKARHRRHVLYFLVLVAMAFLWAPSAQTALYAYLEEVPALPSRRAWPLEYPLSTP